MPVCLVVDDSRTIRAFAADILRALGFSVREAADGREAEAACRDRMPDVVLLDWNMPVTNDLDFAYRLRAMPGGESPKLVFRTTESGIAEIRHALEVGTNEYIIKPFDRDVLTGKLLLAGGIQ